MSFGESPASPITLSEALSCNAMALLPEPRSYAVSPIPTIAALPSNAAAISGLRTGFRRRWEYRSAVPVAKRRTVPFRPGL